MEINFELQEGEIVLLKIKCLTASKKILKQLPKKGSLFPEEMAILEPVAWFDAEAVFGQEYEGYKMGLALIEEKLYLIPLGFSHWPVKFTNAFLEKAQIIIE